MKSFPQFKISESYDEGKKTRYIEFLQQLGSGIHFEEDTWVCDKRVRSIAEPLHLSCIHFSLVPEAYREMSKYYVVLRLLNGDTVTGVNTRLIQLTTFLRFLSSVCGSPPISRCSISTASRFKAYIDTVDYADSTKNSIWFTVGTFFRTMNGFDEIRLRNPFAGNPYENNRKLDYKYIPDKVIKILDEVFKKEEIDLHLRCVYWILRLIPSRITEVLSMKIDCIKPYNGNQVIFIPTWKQNGGNMEPILRSIHIQDAGIAGYLLNLIKFQQKEAERIQEYLPESKRGALFAHQRVNHRNGSVSLSDKYYLVQRNQISYHFKRICGEYGVLDDNGNIYNLTSHQFRHNGITDRLEAGFTFEQIADMTGHHGNAMIWNSYAHLNLKPETIIQKQQYVLNEPESVENSYVLFGGRILNMEEQLEKRLLKNIRAHQVPGGICGDITGCKSDMWNCLECECFIPDRAQLPYFQKQALLWRDKAKKFNNFPLIKDNSLKNAELFEKISAKILLDGGKSDEQ